MIKKIRIGTSPLTGTIFAGSLLKDGRTWAANKQDVTLDAVSAVVDLAMMKDKRGENVAVEDDERRYILELKIVELDKEPSQ